MKKQLSIIALTIILFATVLIIMSCSGTPPTANNTAGNTNSNNTNVNSNSASSRIPPVEDCTPEPSATTKPLKIKKGFMENMNREPYLVNQNSRNFDFRLDDDSGEVIMYIWGKVFISRGKLVLDDFNQTFKGFMKQGCVKKIVFGRPAGSLTTTVSATDFTYEACEYPNELCANGTCAPQGSCQPLTNTNTRANSNMN